MTIQDYAGDDKGFAAWLEKIDARLIRLYGLGVLDLPDQCYRDHYDDGLTASEVIQIMREDGDIF